MSPTLSERREGAALNVVMALALGGAVVAMALAIALASVIIEFDTRADAHGSRLDRVEHRLDRLETTTTTRPVRAQAGRPSRPSTTVPRGACVVVQGGFEMWTSEQDAAGKPRCRR